MPKPDERNVPLSEYRPQAIHDLRNCLGVAVGTADLALLDSTLNQAQARDIDPLLSEKLRGTLGQAT